MNRFIKKNIFFLCLLMFGCGLEQPYNTIIKTADNDTHFNLEIADTSDKQIKGLKGRQSLKDNEGMIFVFEPVQPIAMWMKDTQISLDMLFISPKGKITKIIENTEPFSTKHLLSERPVRAVIELKAGSTQDYKIKVGDTVRHQAFKNFPDIKTKE